MYPEKIEHIGIAVRSLEQASTFYEKVLGLTCYKIETVEEQMVRTAFYRIGDVKLELLEPTGRESPIARFIEKKGEGIHHIALRTNHMKETLENLKTRNIKMINETPKRGADNMNVVFIHPADSGGILYEFCSPVTGMNPPLTTGDNHKRP